VNVDGLDALPTAEDLARTRALLERRQGENERLEAELAATGLSSFGDIADWLMGRWDRDRRLVWRRRWAALGLVRIDPEPVHVQSRVQPTAPCRRCGVDRVVRVGRRGTGLCRDCITVLTKDEVARWAA
jgi:hypothetical protein